MTYSMLEIKLKSVFKIHFISDKKLIFEDLLIAL